MSGDPPALIAVRGGRSWWAHPSFTRINIAPTILRHQTEELMNVRGIGERNFLSHKPYITVTPPRSERAAAQ